jgi:hypothetical protein
MVVGYRERPKGRIEVVPRRHVFVLIMDETFFV